MSDLKRTLGALDVFAISTGAMISSGLFVLPAIVYLKTGPSVVISYLIAAIIILPAMFAKAELTTAMPKSGGTYFFIQRSLGSSVGTFSGFACWLSLSLKSAFALVGIGLFTSPYISTLFNISPQLSVKIVAVSFTLLFGIINCVSVKHTSRFQVVLVLVLIAILLVFIALSINQIEMDRFTPFAPKGYKNIIMVSGMIFISFGGLTKIASVAEEVKNPGRNVPLGMFSSFIVVTILYLVVIFTTIGILDSDILSLSVTPISSAANISMGKAGMVALSIAAIIAFITTGNAGILAASRYPMAMSKDNLIPSIFSKINLKFKTPIISIVTTVLFMALIIIFFDLEHLIKAASTMKLILFAFTCLSVIIMRESGIALYRPEFKSPLYPVIQVLGFLIYLALIFSMGSFPVVIAGCVLVFSLIWYLLYTKRRDTKDSAIIHIAEKISKGRIKGGDLSKELKEILRERDDIQADRFDSLIEEAVVMDIKGSITKDDLFKKIGHVFSKNMDESEDEIISLLNEREDESSTIIQAGLAIPHIVVGGSHKFDIAVIRAKEGVDYGDSSKVKMFFAIGGSLDERNFHLQVLMAIAQIVQNKNFKEQWEKMKTVDDLRNLVLLADRVRKGRI
ncbi:MAG: amino acid permease [Spirochaetaceae bacterium]